jgi:hypothetical protein
VIASKACTLGRLHCPHCTQRFDIRPRIFVKVTVY